MNEPKETASNVLGTPLETCCTNPLTGFYRNGKCHTGPGDHGLHVVCVKVTEAFLLFGRSRGNDLMTSNPQFQFPGSSLEIAGVCVSTDGWKRSKLAVPLP